MINELPVQLQLGLLNIFVSDALTNISRSIIPLHTESTLTVMQNCLVMHLSVI